MIIQFIANMFYALLSAALTLFPSMTISPHLDLSVLGALSWLFPVSELVSLFAMMITFATSSLIYTLVNMIANKIRGSG